MTTPASRFLTHLRPAPLPAGTTPLQLHGLPAPLSLFQESPPKLLPPRSNPILHSLPLLWLSHSRRNTEYAVCNHMHETGSSDTAITLLQQTGCIKPIAEFDHTLDSAIV